MLLAPLRKKGDEPGEVHGFWRPLENQQMELFQPPDFIGASEIRRLEKLHLLRQCLGQNTLMIKVTLNKIGVILPHSYFS